MIRILDNDTLQPIFETSAILRIDVKQEKRATRYQIESGGTRSDHVITNPTEITIDFVIADGDTKAAYEEIHTAYTEERLVTLQTHMGTYFGYLIESMPHTEDASIHKGASVPIRLIEWRETEPEYGELKQMQDPSHTDTNERGRQSGEDAENEQAGSLLYRMAN